MKPMEHAQARNLFYQTDLSQAQIAKLIGISERTLSLWANEGRWRQLRQLTKQTPSVMIDELYAELARINSAIRSRDPGKQFATPQEAEVRRKTLAAVKYVQQRQTSGSHMEVLMNFTTYVLKKNMEDARKITQYADEFIKGEKLSTPNEYKPYRLPEMLDDDTDIQPGDDTDIQPDDNTPVNE